jgi:hypothetical protein
MTFNYNPNKIIQEINEKQAKGGSLSINKTANEVTYSYAHGINAKRLASNPPDSAYLTTYNKMPEGFDGNVIIQNFRNFEEQFNFKLVESYKLYQQVVEDSRNNLPLNDMLMNLVNENYEMNIRINLNHLYNNAPSFFFKKFVAQNSEQFNGNNGGTFNINIEYYQKYIYLLCLINYVVNNMELPVVKAIEGIDDVIKWCLIRRDTSLQFIIIGPVNNIEMDLNFEKHYDILISPANGIDVISQYQTITQLNNISYDMLRTIGILETRPNSFTKLLNESESVTVQIKIDKPEHIINDSGFLKYDCSGISLGDIIGIQDMKGKFYDMKTDSPMPRVMSRIAIKQLEEIFQRYSKFNLEKLTFATVGYKSNITSFLYSDIIFEGVVCPMRNYVSEIDNTYVTFRGTFTGNSLEYEFTPHFKEFTYRSLLVLIRHMKIYINRKFELNPTTYKVPTDDIFNIPIIKYINTDIVTYGENGYITDDDNSERYLLLSAVKNITKRDTTKILDMLLYDETDEIKPMFPVIFFKTKDEIEANKNIIPNVCPKSLDEMMYVMDEERRNQMITQLADPIFRERIGVENVKELTRQVGEVKNSFNAVFNSYKNIWNMLSESLPPETKHANQLEELQRLITGFIHQHYNKGALQDIFIRSFYEFFYYTRSELETYLKNRNLSVKPPNFNMIRSKIKNCNINELIRGLQLIINIRQPLQFNGKITFSISSVQTVTKTWRETVEYLISSFKPTSKDAYIFNSQVILQICEEAKRLRADELERIKNQNITSNVYEHYIVKIDTTKGIIVEEQFKDRTEYNVKYFTLSTLPDGNIEVIDATKPNQEYIYISNVINDLQEIIVHKEDNHKEGSYIKNNYIYSKSLSLLQNTNQTVFVNNDETDVVDMDSYYYFYDGYIITVNIGNIKINIGCNDYSCEDNNGTFEINYLDDEQPYIEIILPNNIHIYERYISEDIRNNIYACTYDGNELVIRQGANNIKIDHRTIVIDGIFKCNIQQKTVLTSYLKEINPYVFIENQAYHINRDKSWAYKLWNTKGKNFMPYYIPYSICFKPYNIKPFTDYNYVINYINNIKTINNTAIIYVMEDESVVFLNVENLNDYKNVDVDLYIGEVIEYTHGYANTRDRTELLINNMKFEIEIDVVNSRINIIKGNQVIFTNRLQYGLTKNLYRFSNDYVLNIFVSENLFYYQVYYASFYIINFVKRESWKFDPILYTNENIFKSMTMTAPKLTNIPIFEISDNKEIFKFNRFRSKLNVNKFYPTPLMFNIPGTSDLRYCNLQTNEKHYEATLIPRVNMEGSELKTIPDIDVIEKNCEVRFTDLSMNLIMKFS